MQKNIFFTNNKYSFNNFIATKKNNKLIRFRVIASVIVKVRIN